jgi:hypothetical protein
LKKPHGYKVGGKKEIHTSRRQRFREEVEETAWIQNARKERYTEAAWIENAGKERYIYIRQGGRDLQKKVKKPHGYNMQGKER